MVMEILFLRKACLRVVYNLNPKMLLMNPNPVNKEEFVFHEDKITLKNNMTELEKAEKRIPMIVKFIQQFLATDLAQQLSPAQRDAINKPGNYTTWPKLTEKLIKDDLERQAMEFINATKEKQATNIIPTSTAQQSETVESNTQLRQENSQATGCRQVRANR